MASSQSLQYIVLFFTAVNCGTPAEGTKSEIFGDDYKFEAEISSKCLPGYKIKSGDETRTCQASGSWSGDPLHCEGKNMY